MKSVGIGGQIYVAENMKRGYGSGNFTLTLNSSRLSAGNDAQSYLIIVEGYHPVYNNPDPILIYTNVMTIPTNYAIYNYDTRQLINDNKYTQLFNELINITIRYYKSSNQNDLYDATMTYEWLWLGTTQFYADPVYDGFYTFTLNTSAAINTGQQFIHITVSLENYTMHQFSVSLFINPRLTTLNGESEILSIKEEIYNGTAYNFTFIYRDYFTSNILGDINDDSYIWRQYNSTGHLVSNGIGSLIEQVDKSYVLDFDTKHRNIGNYTIFLSFEKNNFEIILVYITLLIIEKDNNINNPSSDDDDNATDDTINFIIFITLTSSITVTSLILIYTLRRFGAKRIKKLKLKKL